MTRAIIFDLDSCLSAADEPGQLLYAPAFHAITHASRGSHIPSVLQNAFPDMWRLPFDFVAKKYSFTPAMKDAGWEALTQLEVNAPMQGYGDLDVLKELPVQRFLVTSGFRRLQESKIHALGIRPLFTALISTPSTSPATGESRKSSRTFSAITDYTPIKCSSWATITTPRLPSVSASASEPFRRCVPGCRVQPPRPITSGPCTNSSFC